MSAPGTKIDQRRLGVRPRRLLDQRVDHVRPQRRQLRREVRPVRPRPSSASRSIAACRRETRRAGRASGRSASMPRTRPASVDRRARQVERLQHRQHRRGRRGRSPRGRTASAHPARTSPRRRRRPPPPPQPRRIVAAQPPDRERAAPPCDAPAAQRRPQLVQRRLAPAQQHRRRTRSRGGTSLTAPNMHLVADRGPAALAIRGPSPGPARFGPGRVHVDRLQHADRDQVR